MEFLASLAIKALVGTSICGTVTVGTIYKCDKTLLGFKDNAQQLPDNSGVNGGGEDTTQATGEGNNQLAPTVTKIKGESSGVVKQGEQSTSTTVSVLTNEGAGVSTPNEEVEAPEDVNDDKEKVSADGGTGGVEADNPGQSSGAEVLSSVGQTGQNVQSDSSVTPKEQPPIVDAAATHVTLPIATIPEQQTQNEPITVSQEEPQSTTDLTAPVQSEPQPVKNAVSPEPSDQSQQEQEQQQ